MVRKGREESLSHRRGKEKDRIELRRGKEPAHRPASEEDNKCGYMCESCIPREYRENSVNRLMC